MSEGDTWDPSGPSTEDHSDSGNTLYGGEEGFGEDNSIYDYQGTTDVDSALAYPQPHSSGIDPRTTFDVLGGTYGQPDGLSGPMDQLSISQTQDPPDSPDFQYQSFQDVGDQTSYSTSNQSDTFSRQSITQSSQPYSPYGTYTLPHPQQQASGRMIPSYPNRGGYFPAADEPSGYYDASTQGNSNQQQILPAHQSDNGFYPGPHGHHQQNGHHSRYGHITRTGPSNRRVQGGNNRWSNDSRVHQSNIGEVGMS